MKRTFARIKFNFKIIFGTVFLVSAVFCLFFYFSAKASINKQVNYQGKLTDGNNWAVADGNYNMVFKIYDAVTGGNLLWTGTHTSANGNPVAVSAGIFSVLLGSGTGNTLNLDFSNSSNYYLQIEIYNSGTSAWEVFDPRRPVASVPQAYNANNVIGDGRIDVTTDSSSNASLKVTQAGTGDVAQFFDGSTQVVTVKDGGNVGIGTTAPGAKLDVSGAAMFGYFTHTANNQGSVSLFGDGTNAQSGAYYSKMRIFGGSSQTRSIDLYQVNSGGAYISSTYGDLNLITSGNNANILITPNGTGNIQMTGNVGIGTTSPGSRLTASIDQSAQSANVPLANLSVTGTAAVTKGSILHLSTTRGIGTDDTDIFRVFGDNSGTSPFFTIRNTGKVGIGTTNVTDKLTVNGNATIDGNITFGGTALTHITSFLDGNGDDWDIRVGNPANNNFSIYNSSQSRYDLVINGSGNVGIGTTEPGTKLDVSGNLAFGPTNGRQSYYSDFYSVPTATQVNIALREGVTSLASGWNYKIKLVTTGTAISSGAEYIISQDASGVWTSKLVSAKGYTANHPLLGISGTNVFVYHNHASTYSINTFVEGYYTANLTTTAADFFGLGASITSLAGNVGIGTAGPGAKLDVRGNILAGGGAVDGGTSANSFLSISDSSLTNSRGIQFLGNDGTQNPRVNIRHITNGDHYVQFNSAFSTGIGYADWVFTNGNVGIGTTSPENVLDLGNGTAGRALVFAKYGSFGTEYSDADVLIGRMVKPKLGAVGEVHSYTGTHTVSAIKLDNSGDFQFSTQASGAYVEDDTYDFDSNIKMVVKNSGNVGIGTTTPEAKLNVVLDTNNVDIIRASTAAHSVGLGVDSASIYWGASIFQDGTKRFTVESNYGLLVGSSYQSSAAPSNGAIIEGNVGIGTTNATNKLKIETIDSNTSPGMSQAQFPISIRNSNTTSNNYVGISFTGGSNNTSAAIVSKLIDHANDYGTIGFYTRGTSGWGEKMTVSNTGKVGIGTTAPINKLHVEGTGGGSAGIYLNSAVPSATSNTLYNNGGSLYWNGSAVGGSSSQWTTQGTSVYYNTGKVGIGITAPSTDLYVKGSSNNMMTLQSNSTAGTSFVITNETNSANYEFAVTGTGNGYGSGHFLFWDGLNARGPLILNANGNIRIGHDTGYTATTASSLSIYGNLAVGGSYISNAAPTNGMIVQGNLGVGTTAPGVKMDVSGGAIRTNNQLISTVATGTAPLAVSSTTAVSNLNADLLDGQHASAFATSDTVVRLSAVRYYSSTTTWNKPAGLSYVIVEVWGGGGGGYGAEGDEYNNIYCYYPGTGGGTSSFGSFLSATGGSGYGSGGTGSGGNINLTGGTSLAGVGGSSPRGGTGGISPGGGGASNSSSCYSGGGGGYSQEMLLSSSLSASHTATVGAGGGAGSGGFSGAAGAVAVYEYTTVTSGTDLAENYPVKDPTISAGEIVTFDAVNPIGIKRAEQGDKAPMAGIIATKPGLVLSDDQKDTTGQRPVALAGRVPTKVNLEGGEIKIGDRITISSVPGVGRKANSFEPSVGVALEGYAGGEQMITVSIDLNPGIDVNELKNQIFETDMNNADERSKENQQILSYGLNELMLMTPKQYTQISTFLQNGTLVQDRNKTQETFGFIAQEMYQLIPQVVKKPKEGSDGLWEIDYSKIVPIVVKSVQEQQAEITSQKLEVESLTVEMDNTKLQVAGIDTRLATIEASNTAQETTLQELERKLAELEEGSLMMVDGSSTEEEIFSPSAEGEYPEGGRGLETDGIIDPSASSSDSSAPPLDEGRKIDGITALSISEQLQGEVLANLNVENLTVIENVIVAGDIKVEGHIQLGNDSIGKAKIVAGATKVHITFTKPYLYQPIITATQMDFIAGQYKVSEVTTEGFTIEISEAQTEDIMFSWHAFASEEGKVFMSDGTNEEIGIKNAIPLFPAME